MTTDDKVLTAERREQLFQKIWKSNPKTVEEFQTRFPIFLDLLLSNYLVGKLQPYRISLVFSKFPEDMPREPDDRYWGWDFWFSNGQLRVMKMIIEQGMNHRITGFMKIYTPQEFKELVLSHLNQVPVMKFFALVDVEDSSEKNAY